VTATGPDSPRHWATWRAGRLSWSTIWPTLIGCALLVVTLVGLRGRLPSISAVGHALRTGALSWVLIAAAFEVVSMDMFARQQRGLLRAVSVRMSQARALGVTYIRSAISTIVPAGSAVSAAYAFQQYRRSGADREQATAVTVLSGIVSVVGLGLLYVVGAAVLIARDPIGQWRDHPATLAALGAGLVAVAAIWWGVRRLAASPAYARSAAAPGTDTRSGITAVAPRAAGSRRRRIAAVVGTFTRDAIRAGRTVSPGSMALATAFAAANWLTDLLCFAGSARAFGLPVGFATLATIYLGAQIIRQIPLTPGGVGLIEAGLLAGLASAGAAAAAAAATVLTYRVLSNWLIVPIGGLAWFGLRRPPARPQRPATLRMVDIQRAHGPLGAEVSLGEGDPLGAEDMLPEAANG
jgi:putative heme transporter